jgi:hypothetical protein
MVKESVEQVVEQAVAHRHRILQGPGARERIYDLGPALRDRDGGEE